MVVIRDYSRDCALGRRSTSLSGGTLNNIHAYHTNIFHGHGPTQKAPTALDSEKQRRCPLRQSADKYFSVTGKSIQSMYCPTSTSDNTSNPGQKQLARNLASSIRSSGTSAQLLTLYQAQVRSCMDYCSHLWDGSAKYQLDALDSVDRRARRLIGDLANKKLQSLEHRRKVACLSVFYRIYFGVCAQQLFDLFPPRLFTIEPRGTVMICIPTWSIYRGRVRIASHLRF
ncbi:jg13478 [Pararge aegeria aegeria]|uniref:Jg13478 protein n=1 Tax=Pararge aegeria aegeria TaxID=348720 RepID=A0A8S4RMF6_9NEOP|nr:jg13478 [Pararge aegeria aegeria]